MHGVNHAKNFEKCNGVKQCMQCNRGPGASAGADVTPCSVAQWLWSLRAALGPALRSEHTVGAPSAVFYRSPERPHVERVAAEVANHVDVDCVNLAATAGLGEVWARRAGRRTAEVWARLLSSGRTR